jgi:uncharacterized alpha-E superfamily protein
MLSRVAESIYWMARYVERAENTARLVNVNMNLMLDLPRAVRPGWDRLVEISGAAPLFDELHRRADERVVMRFLLGDLRNPGSMLSSLQQARENARTIRDIIPREAWEQLNTLYRQSHDGITRGLTQKGRFDYLRGVIHGSQMLTGILAGCMTHDHGYGFLKVGRNLERADMTTRIIDVRSADLLGAESREADELLAPYANLQWMSVLKSLTGYQMYRREMQVRVQRPEVLRFLLHNERFPRAVNHCLGQVEQCLAQLPRSDAPRRIARAVTHTVEAAPIDELDQSALHEFIDGLQLGMGEIHESISATYFRHEPRRKATP